MCNCRFCEGPWNGVFGSCTRVNSLKLSRVLFLLILQEYNQGIVGSPLFQGPGMPQPDSPSSQGQPAAKGCLSSCWWLAVAPLVQPVHKTREVNPRLCSSPGISNPDQALVEDPAVCMGAGALWNVGWGLHLLHDQHFWSGSFPEDGMACGE